MATQRYNAGIQRAKGLLEIAAGLYDSSLSYQTKRAAEGMEQAKIDSPRGAWTMSKAHNPIQDIYLRKVTGRENKFVSVAHKALADPARGCKM